MSVKHAKPTLAVAAE